MCGKVLSKGRRTEKRKEGRKKERNRIQIKTKGRGWGGPKGKKMQMPRDIQEHSICLEVSLGKKRKKKLQGS